jgi:hypothetical protein
MTITNPTDDQIVAATVRWLASVTGLTFIQGYQSGDRPALPYGVVYLDMSMPLTANAANAEYGIVDLPETESDDDVVEAGVTAWEWRLSINIYGADAAATLRKITMSRRIRSLHDLFRPYVIHRFSAIRNLPEEIDTGWEERSQMDIFVHGYAKDYAHVYVIEEAPLDAAQFPDTEGA